MHQKYGNNVTHAKKNAYYTQTELYISKIAFNFKTTSCSLLLLIGILILWHAKWNLILLCLSLIHSSGFDYFPQMRGTDLHISSRNIFMDIWRKYHTSQFMFSIFFNVVINHPHLVRAIKGFPTSALLVSARNMQVCAALKG